MSSEEEDWKKNYFEREQDGLCVRIIRWTYFLLLLLYRNIWNEERKNWTKKKRESNVKKEKGNSSPTTKLFFVLSWCELLFFAVVTIHIENVIHVQLSSWMNERKASWKAIKTGYLSLSLVRQTINFKKTEKERRESQTVISNEKMNNWYKWVSKRLSLSLSENWEKRKRENEGRTLWEDHVIKWPIISINDFISTSTSLSTFFIPLFQVTPSSILELPRRFSFETFTSLSFTLYEPLSLSLTLFKSLSHSPSDECTGRMRKGKEKKVGMAIKMVIKVRKNGNVPRILNFRPLPSSLSLSLLSPSSVLPLCEVEFIKNHKTYFVFFFLFFHFVIPLLLFPFYSRLTHSFIRSIYTSSFF